MKHPWGLLLLRSQLHSHLRISSISSHFQVLSNPNPNPNLQSIRSLSSLLHNRSIHQSHFTNNLNPRHINSRTFSSEPAVEQKESDPAVLLVSDIFSKSRDSNEIRKDLDLNGNVINHDLVLDVLGKLESNPDVAIGFFDWVLGNYGEKVSSKSYNLMLRILGVNGSVKEFWDMNCDMMKKGYRMTKSVRDDVMERFGKDGLEIDVLKLRDVFASGSVDKSPEKIGLIVSRIVRGKVWDDGVERQLRDMDIEFSSDMVKMILEKLCLGPAKAFIFFRWLGESGLFKHDEKTYNAMAMVLGREDCIDRFWNVVDEMRSCGFEMEMETFAKVLGRFCKRRMMEEAVNLYGFAIGGSNKPSLDCLTFLLKKIVVGKQLDLSLFSRTLKVFTENGNVLTDSMVSAVLKSLTAVGRVGECNQVLNAMRENGYVSNSNLNRKVAYQLGSTRCSGEANEFMNNLEACGCHPDNKTWASLIKGYCDAGDLANASDCLYKMVDKEGVFPISSAGFALDSIVNAYCQMNQETDASHLLCNLIDEKELKPWYSTYKSLISKLLVRGEFKEALKLLGLMRNHKFPPVIDPFIAYVSKSGTCDDAIGFLKAMTSKRFPSMSVVILLFKAFFEARRHEDAQDLLSKCPVYIRNHADVLNLCYYRRDDGSRGFI